MNSLDSWLYIIGIELLAILACVWRLSQEATIKRRVRQGILLVLGFMLAHVFTHLLPNAMACFIFSSYHQFAPRNLWNDPL